MQQSRVRTCLPICPPYHAGLSANCCSGRLCALCCATKSQSRLERPSQRSCALGCQMRLRIGTAHLHICAEVAPAQLLHRALNVTTAAQIPHLLVYVCTRVREYEPGAVWAPGAQANSATSSDQQSRTSGMTQVFSVDPQPSTTGNDASTSMEPLPKQSTL